MPDGSNLPTREQASPREFRLVLTGLMLALTLASLDQNIVATALPRITGDLGGLRHLSWVVTSFVVASTVSAPLYGRLSDIYGRKPAFAVSISVFLLGSVLCGLARSMAELIGFRALQGLGGGGLMVLAQTVIGDLVSPRERGRYQGLFAAVFTACSVAGPLVGGVLTEYASWRWVFYVNLPVGAVALLLIMLALRPRPRGPAPRLDLAGAALLVTGTTCLMLLLSTGGGDLTSRSATVLGLATACLASFAILIPVERRAKLPILPPRLFRNRVFVIATGAIMLTAMALFAAAVFLPLLFQLLMGASPTQAGLMIAPLMGGVIVASFTGGRIISRTGRYKALPVAGLFVVTLSYVALVLAVRTGLGATTIEAILVAMGAGLGLVLPTLTTAIQNAVSPGELGGATAMAGFFRSLGGAVGVALSGAVLALHLRLLPDPATGADTIARIAGLPAAPREAVLAAYRAGLSGAFTAGAVVAATGLVVVLFLPELPLRAASARPVPENA